jgi:hypothetical protein
MPFNSETAKKAGEKSSRSGVRNRIGSELKEKLLLTLSQNIDNFQKDFKALKPKERIEMTIKLFEYALPKIKNAEKTDDEEKTNDQKLIEAMEFQKERKAILFRNLELAKRNRKGRELNRS